MPAPFFNLPHYDITFRRGEDFTFHFVHKDEEGNVIGVTGATGEMQIRKSPLSARMSAWIRGASATGGIAASGTAEAVREFYATGGTGHSGCGFTFGVDEDGSTPLAGGVFLRIPAEMGSLIPSGMNFYDIIINTGATGGVRKARTGEFFVELDVTRNQ